MHTKSGGHTLLYVEDIEPPLLHFSVVIFYAHSPSTLIQATKQRICIKRLFNTPEMSGHVNLLP